MTETDKVNNTQQGPFELDLTGEMEQEFKRTVQISMPRGGGVHQFNIECWYAYGTSDDITAAGDERTLMMTKLKRWSPAIKVRIQDPETGLPEPRRLGCDTESYEELEENKRLLLSIPWLRQPISQAWFNAILGNSQSAGKTKN